MASMPDAWPRLVYQVVRQIPRGRVASYGLVGLLAGRPLAARAVGNALRRCDDRGVPCHRVVRASGEPAFPAHRVRLRREGVHFIGQRVDLARHLWSPRLPGSLPTGKLAWIVQGARPIPGERETGNHRGRMRSQSNLRLR